MQPFPPGVLAGFVWAFGLLAPSPGLCQAAPPAEPAPPEASFPPPSSDDDTQEATEDTEEPIEGEPNSSEVAQQESPSEPSNTAEVTPEPVQENDQAATGSTAEELGLEGSSGETAPPSETPESPNDTSEELVPRIETPESSRQSAAFAPEPASQFSPVVLGPPDRHTDMPARMVDRPLSLPEGILLLQWSMHAVFVDYPATTAHMPGFAWGITDRIELGLTGSFRFDEGSEEWTALDPTPHVLVTAIDTDRFEWGVLGSILIPGTKDSSSVLTLALPARVHTERFRIDASPRFEWFGEKGVGSLLGLWLNATYQATRAVYLGVGAGPELGLGKKTESGVDTELHLGASMQARGRALVDVEAAFFFENLGGGPSGHFSDGGGFTASIRFFPDMY